MKLLTVLLALICSAAALQAQVPAKKNTAKPVEKKVEEPKIPGQVLTRSNGTFLSLTLEEGKFKLGFYDAKKKAMAPDVARAVARWPNVHGPGQNRSVLNPADDGKSLLSAQFVRGPYAFTLILVLIKGDGEEGETYSVRFQG
ncbi:hypothetical protein [Oleiharenicola lentus]|uniref:hypothetical protein n=1 Tax=Oleiharenicola lentus TaxID=2508720 RepID=UPI003F6660D4